MKDGLIRNSEGIIVQLQVGMKVIPGSAIVRIARHGEDGPEPYTTVHTIDGNDIIYNGTFGDDLWRQARS